MPTKRNKNYGALLLPLLMLWPALTAPAENEEVIARCAKIPGVGDRILCLEDALRESSQPGEAAVAADAVVEENPTPESGASAAAAAVAVGSAEFAEEVTEPAGQSVPTDVASATQAAETIPAAVDAVTAADTSEAQQFGLSKVQNKPKPLDSVNVVVVAVDRSAYGKLLYTTDSGQVWRQTDQGRPSYRQIPFDAEIRKGAAGSFFIRPLSGGAAVRVKRSK
jgi:hypothetical protein